MDGFFIFKVDIVDILVVEIVYGGQKGHPCCELRVVVNCKLQVAVPAVYPGPDAFGDASNITLTSNAFKLSSSVASSSLPNLQL